MDLGFFPLLSPDLRVCNIVLFSGLGLLLVFFIGGASIGEYVGFPELIRGLGAAGDDDCNEPYVLDPTTACSELFFPIMEGRCGSGGGRDKSG